MTKETLYRCRALALKYRDLQAELKTVYDTAKSVSFSKTAGGSPNRGTSDPTARAAFYALELEERTREAQAAAWDAADIVEAWMNEADIDPGACAGIRLYFVVGMDWPEIENRLTPFHGKGARPRIKSKTLKALKAAGITE